MAPMMPSDQVMGNLPPKASLSHTILRPTKMSTMAEAVLQEVELVHHAGEQEEHRAQAEDGEDVGREDHRAARGSARRSRAPLSTAKMMSESSRNTSATKSGVACMRPVSACAEEPLALAAWA
jgi:hypothetical protein